MKPLLEELFNKLSRLRDIPLCLVTQPGFYPVVDVPKKLVNRKHAKTATLRSSITPGTILILLAGPYRGRVSES